MKSESIKLLTALSNLFVTANNFSSKYGINWDSTLLAKSLSPPQASAKLKETRRQGSAVHEKVRLGFKKKTWNRNMKFIENLFNHHDMCLYSLSLSPTCVWHSRLAMLPWETRPRGIETDLREEEREREIQ